MKLKPMIEVAKQTNRKAGRDAYVTDLRDGRRMRPQTIPSGKTYQRKPKHGGFW